MTTRKNSLDVSKFLQDPLMVATSCSWRRILTHSGKPVCVPTNANDGHPDLCADPEMLVLFSAAPELYESNLMLLDALKKVLSGDKTSNLVEVIGFAENALHKAEKNIHSS